MSRHWWQTPWPSMHLQLLLLVAAAVGVFGSSLQSDSQAKREGLIELELQATSQLIKAYKERLSVLQSLKDRADLGEE